MNASVRLPRLPIPQPRIPLPARLPAVGPRIASVGTGATAPVCPITQGETAPVGPSIPVALPAPAVDLPSAIQAINQLRQVVNMFINPPANPNFFLFLPQPPKPVWTEINRKMVTTRVYNPDDASMWVDVQHIAMLEMADKVTGQTMTLNYAAPKAGAVGIGPAGTVGPGGPATTPGQ